MRTLLPIVALALTGAGATGGPSLRACDESCLLGITGDYLDALTSDDPSSAPFGPNLRATENGAVTPPGQGIWRTATGWQYRHSFVDPASGGIGVFGIVVEGDRKAFVTVRLKVDGRRIVESELMVAREGDFSLFNPQATQAKPVFGALPPPTDRQDRAHLVGIARRYFDGITRGDPSDVPFHPDCNRVENGFQTTNSPPRAGAGCAEGLRRFSYMQRYRELRFPVVDVRRGLVWAITAFDLPEQRRTVAIRGKPFEISPERQHLPRTLFLYELFKVEDGRIREIEAQMRNAPLGASMGWPERP